MANKQLPYSENASFQPISQEAFRVQYNQRRPQYERLAVNLQQALKAFLADKQIPYLDVTLRIKGVDSAL